MRNRFLWKKNGSERLIGNLRDVADDKANNDNIDGDESAHDDAAADDDGNNNNNATREDKFALNSMATWYDDFRSR